MIRILDFIVTLLSRGFARVFVVRMEGGANWVTAVQEVVIGLIQAFTRLQKHKQKKQTRITVVVSPILFKRKKNKQKKITLVQPVQGASH